MKACLYFILFLLVLAPTAASPADPNFLLPKEISKYYADYNFVNLFSSPGERHALIYQREKIALDEIRKDKRLKRVMETLDRLRMYKHKVDPDISIGNVDPDISIGCRKSKRINQSSSIIDIINVKETDQKLSILVVHHGINSDDQLKLIKDYDKCLEGIIGELIIETTFRRNEVHFWENEEGVWLKSEMTIGLLNESAATHLLNIKNYIKNSKEKQIAQ